jgi:hypothetical protein
VFVTKEIFFSTRFVATGSAVGRAEAFEPRRVGPRLVRETSGIEGQGGMCDDGI